MPRSRKNDVAPGTSKADFPGGALLLSPDSRQGMRALRLHKKRLGPGFGGTTWPSGSLLAGDKEDL
jgi:hypothetical protein